MKLSKLISTTVSIILVLAYINCGSSITKSKSSESSNLNTTNSFSIISVFPDNESTSIARNTDISIEFENEVDITSLTIQSQNGECSNSIQVSSDDFLSCRGGSLDASLNPDFYITLNELLSANKTYKIKVLKTVKNKDGKILAENYVQITGFATSDATDSLEPLSVSLNISDNAKDVSYQGILNLTFSKEIEEDSLGTLSDSTCSASVQLSNNNFVSCIPLKLSYNDNPVFTIKPVSNLEMDSSYSFRIESSVKAVDSNYLDNAIDISFATCGIFDGNTSCNLELTGALTTLAGSAKSTTPRYLDGTGNAARFYNPTAITTDGTNLYVMDSESDIVKKIVIASTVVTTIAGPNNETCTANTNSCPGGDVDGTGDTARFALGRGGIATDGGYVYISDRGNSKIKRINLTTQNVVTIAGTSSGFNDGVGSSAMFQEPSGMVYLEINSIKYLFVIDTLNQRIRRVNLSDGNFTVETIAGNGTNGFADDVGSSAEFSFNSVEEISGIATDGTSLYVVDAGNFLIRKVSLSSPYTVSTIAGIQGVEGNQDGTVSPAQATIGVAQDLVYVGNNLYFIDKSTPGSRIRKISLSTPQIVSTFAGPTQTSLDTNCGNPYPYCKYDAVSIGTGLPPDGLGTNALFSFPIGITTDGIRLYVVDQYSSIRKID